MLNRRLSDFSPAVFLARTTSTSDSSTRSNNQREPSDAAHDFGWHVQRASAVPWIVSADESQLHYIGAEDEALTGLSCASLYADPESWMDVLHPEDRDRVVAPMEAPGQGPHDDERDAVYRIVHSGASARRIRVCSWPIRDDETVVLFRAGIVLDVMDCAEDAVEPPRLNADADMTSKRFSD